MTIKEIREAAKPLEVSAIELAATFGKSFPEIREQLERQGESVKIVITDDPEGGLEFTYIN